MISRRILYFLFLHRILDLLVVAGAFYCAAPAARWWGAGGGVVPGFQRENLWLIVAALALWAVALNLSGIYYSQRGRSLLGLLANVVRVNLLAGLGFSATLFFLEFDAISRGFLIWFALLATGLLLVEKLAVVRVLEEIRKHGNNTKQVLMVGGGFQAWEIVERIRNSPEAGLQVIGVVTDDPSPPLPGDSPVLGRLGDLARILHERVVDEVIICLPFRQITKIRRVLTVCEEIGLNGRVATQSLALGNARIYNDELLNIPLFSISTQPRRDLAFLLKNLIDLGGGVALLILLTPLFLAIGTWIKLSSPGRVFFTQERMGYNGRRFRVYKFRSMIENAEVLKTDLLAHNEVDGPIFKIRHDPRVTRVGEFIRRTSIDELPQLLNVIKGEMSLVGPRPLPVSEALQITGSQRRRLSMKPGMTGLWQVSGRSNTTYQRMIELDLEYIDNWSLALDFKILLRTALVLVNGQGAY